MRKLLKWLGRGVLVLAVIAAALGVWKRAEIARLLAVNTLFDADRIVTNFSNMDQLFLTQPVPRGDGPVARLTRGAQITLPAPVQDWVIRRNVTSLLVLKDGQVVYEDYYLGTTPEDRRISWSMAKSFLSVLFGILLDDGTIESIDDPVTKYAPDLTGTAYDGATIRHVLNMASGVKFDEDYLDFKSDINRMGRVLALGGRMDRFTTRLDARIADPGTDWQYVSIDTHVIGMVIRGATGRGIADLMSEKIMTPLGLEETPYYLTDGRGVAFVLGGLNMRTRDYARFGQMVLDGGVYNGTRIAPADWIDAAIAPTAPTGPFDLGYGYQWWVPRNAPTGEVMARGIYGQYIHIDRNKGTVIVTTAADRQFKDPGVSDENIAMFRLITQGL